MPQTVSTVEINYEDDVVTARQRARQVARLLAFDEQDQTRISTAVSEGARIFVNRRRPSRVEFLLEGNTAPQLLVVRIGWSHVSAPARNSPSTSDGEASAALWEAAVVSAGRLMDRCEVRSDSPDGPAIWLTKILPKRAPFFAGNAFERLIKQLGAHEPQNPMEEVRQQNQELLHALEALHERQQELVRLNRELEDTNRGVVALYAELDEKAGHLRRADDMKSRFLSNMSHEFRTPLNAIIALSRLLLGRSDGDLTSEQEKQVRYIQNSGYDLLELVNDLLDLAKIEAGKIDVKPVDFEVGNLFSALRGMLRPLLVTSAVNFVFEEPKGIPVMRTDEGKVSQILRNFISNAIKFTEQGHVRVAAALSGDGRSVMFSVADTGIGIAEEDQARIFEEFSQIDHPIQKQVKGTGLGLPLCRKLAGLLGGSVGVTSRPGAGSTFVATIPVIAATAGGDRIEQVDTESWQPDANRLPILIVEDEPQTRLLYEKYLRDTAFQAIPAGSIRQARELLERHRVKAIVLDILLPDGAAWQWLAELKGQEATKQIPVLIVSTVEDPRKGLALGADDYCVKPVQRTWLLERLEQVTGMPRDGAPGLAPVVLIIDDQEADRYILRRQLADLGCSIAEAATGEEGLRLARELNPALILLDLNMPGMDGFQAMERLREDAALSAVPVVVITSHVLTPEHRAALAHARAVLSKQDSSTASWQRVFGEVGLTPCSIATGS